MKCAVELRLLMVRCIKLSFIRLRFIGLPFIGDHLLKPFERTTNRQRAAQLLEREFARGFG